MVHHYARVDDHSYCIKYTIDDAKRKPRLAEPSDRLKLKWRGKEEIFKMLRSRKPSDRMKLKWRGKAEILRC